MIFVFHSCKSTLVFFFLFFLQWCVLNSCMCVCEGGISGVGLLCQEGGREGGMAGGRVGGVNGEKA